MKFHKDKIYDLLKKEKIRQTKEWNLIASENYAYKEVLELVGSEFSNKYAEGIPGRRFYAGCKYIDEVEILAVENAKKVFGCEYANACPHSGSNANVIVYHALLEKGDTVLAMDFACGGHLSHGYPKHMSALLYNFIFYGVKKDTQEIDYDEVREKVKKYKPKMLISGASAYSLLIDYKKMKKICDEFGVIHMVDMAHIAGLIAGKVIPSPIPYADVLTLTTHKTLRGPRGGMILAKEKYSRRIDFATMPGFQGGQIMGSIAAKAWVLEYAQTDEFKKYQQNILDNCSAMVDVFKEQGIPIVSKKSENHLCILDLTSLNLSGKQVMDELEKCGIIVNQNTVPYDLKSPLIGSGIRLGSPFMTSMKKNKNDFSKIALIISDILFSL